MLISIRRPLWAICLLFFFPPLLPPIALAQTEKEQDRTLRENSQSGPAIFQVGTGYHYSEGDDGTDLPKSKTHIVSSTLAVAYGGYSLSASLPWEHFIFPVEEEEDIHLRGLGDVSTSLSGILPSPTENISFDWYAGLVLPTASVESGLGAGELIYSLGLDATRDWESFYISTGIGTDFSRSGGGMSLSAEIGYDITDTFSTAFTYDWASSGAETDDSHEITASFGYDVTDKSNIQFYTGTGFSDTSPDLMGGISILTRL